MTADTAHPLRSGTGGSPAPPPLPGAVGISRLQVYSSAAADGVVGGTPHMHLACSEGYYVTGGAGAVHTLTARGQERVPLRAGTVAWFTPGTVHRLVNEGDLEIVTLMQNGGLPEAGDAVLTLPSSVLSDPERYDREARLPRNATLDDARRRRDLAVQGLAELTAALERHGPPALEAFYRAAAAIVRPRLQGWRALWEDGARRAAQDTADQLDALGDGDVTHLLSAGVHARPDPDETGRLGMCGLLDTYPSVSHEVG